MMGNLRKCNISHCKASQRFSFSHFPGKKMFYRLGNQKNSAQEITIISINQGSDKCNANGKFEETQYKPQQSITAFFIFPFSS